MAIIPNKLLAALAKWAIGPSGIRVSINEHVTAKEIIRYNYLCPVIGGHIWISGIIERDVIVVIDSVFTGRKVVFMNQVIWDKVKEQFYESN